MKIEITMTEICLLADLIKERFLSVPANTVPEPPKSREKEVRDDEDCGNAPPAETKADEFMRLFKAEMGKHNEELAAAGLPTIKVGEIYDSEECGVESEESDVVFKDVPAEEDDDDQDQDEDDDDNDEIAAQNTSETIGADEFVDDCAFALKAAGSTLENATPQKICDALVAHGGYADADKTDVRETLIDCCNNHHGSAFNVSFHRIGRGVVFTFTKKNCSRNLK